MLSDEQLKRFMDQNQQFWSATQPGHPDLPSADGDM